MYKRISKAVSVALCIFMMASFAACNSKVTEKTSAASTTSDPNGKYTPAITIKTVRSLNSDVKFDTSNPDRKSLTENIWAKTYEEQLGIKWDYLWTPNSDQYAQKWNVAIASNDIPDMAAVDGTIYKELLQGGLIEDMTKTYNDYASDLYKKANKDDLGITLKYMTTGGKLFGLPDNGSAPENLSLLFIRKDWLKKVNMTEPKTIDDLVKVATAFKDAKLGGSSTTGICVGKNIIGGQNDLVGFFNGFGAYYDTWIKDDSGKLVYGSTQPAMKPALLKLQQMYKSGLIAQDFAVKDSPKAGQDVASGKSGIAYGTFWAPLGTIKDSMVADTTADWEVCPLPTVDGSPFKSQVSAAPGGYVFVKKGFAHPEAAVKVLNLNLKLAVENPTTYATTKDGFEVFKYQVCGLGLPWASTNTYLNVAEALKNNDTSKLNLGDKGTYDNVTAGLKGDRKNLGFNLVFGQDSTEKYVNELKNNNRLVVDQYQSLPTDTMQSVGSTIKDNLDSAILKVIMGDDISAFDKAVSQWKEAGGDKITNEVNDWYAKNK